ncbi:IS21 family transposase [Microbacterium sp. MPKO10]|uniref:Mu transposase domain-containing protein n=1 Tax=Microbacterium sp. MPKO10 TaxID=2989818 RepID=UPI0022358EFF|nr:IS21 family transposase [Microbacterium sp. MPKO10]MCW4457351.1 IS21 family transposase [Microbacterium sp. MPKO10]
MLSLEDDVDIHALKRQGMTISEIARRTNHDRKTVRAYLSGQRQPGERKRQVPDPFAAFVAYVTARLTEDPHLWAVTLLDELRPLGYAGSYQTLTRQIRSRGLRPACQACAHVTKRPNALIEHPPGEETQFDWVEMPDPPAAWGFPTKRAFVLVGSLAHSGVWRAVISPSMDLPHLLAAMTTLLGLLGELTRVWRFDRMTTVLKAGTSDLTPMFAAFSKHHAIEVVACRPRSGNRKGVVEKNNHTAAQRWWRNLADELTLEQAQTSLEAFATSQDQRRRDDTGGKSTAAAMFANERLRPLPSSVFPVVVTEERTATRQALVDWRGNRYSVPVELAASKVLVRQRLGADIIDIATTAGTVIARHALAEPGLGVTVRDTVHVRALETIALASAPPGRPHRRKERIPPGPAALHAAEILTGADEHPSTVIDLAAYEQAAKNRNTLR